MFIGAKHSNAGVGNGITLKLILMANSVRDNQGYTPPC